jgi:DNA-binding MarR family transcriptional regulator
MDGAGLGRFAERGDYRCLDQYSQGKYYGAQELRTMNAIYTVEQYDPPKTVGYLVNRARSEIIAALDQELSEDPELAPLDISAAQYIVLSSVWSRDPESSTRICRDLSYDPGAMTRMVDRLEAKGLLQRKRCPDDRRLVNVELTEAGLAVMPKMRACSVRVLNRLLRGFSADEVHLLERLLARLVENR